MEKQKVRVLVVDVFHTIEVESCIREVFWKSPKYDVDAYEIGKCKQTEKIISYFPTLPLTGPNELSCGWHLHGYSNPTAAPHLNYFTIEGYRISGMALIFGKPQIKSSAVLLDDPNPAYLYTDAPTIDEVRKMIQNFNKSSS